MAKKIGSIVYATDQGLGYMAKDFYDHGLIDEVLVHPHTKRDNHFDWYPKRCVTAEDVCHSQLDWESRLIYFWIPAKAGMTKGGGNDTISKT